MGFATSSSIALVETDGHIESAADRARRNAALSSDSFSARLLAVAALAEVALALDGWGSDVVAALPDGATVDVAHTGPQHDVPDIALAGDVNADAVFADAGDNVHSAEGDDTPEFMVDVDVDSVGHSPAQCFREDPVVKHSSTNIYDEVATLPASAFAQLVVQPLEGKVLLGNDGSDVLVGGLGNDLLEGGKGDDVLIGGAGSDTASYAHAEGSVAVVLTDAVVSNGETGGSSSGADGIDTLVSIENIIGGAFDDSLSGNSGANVLEGGAGLDILSGGFGADTFVFKSVIDINGDDGGSDVITDFEAGIDHIDISLMTTVRVDMFNDAFIFDGEHSEDGWFYEHGHVGYRHAQNGEDWHTFVEGNAGDAVDTFNFHIDLVGAIQLTSADFVL